MPAEYTPALPARVVGSEETEVDGTSVVEVEVRGADGATTSFVVRNEDGARVCGASSAG